MFHKFVFPICCLILLTTILIITFNGSYYHPSTNVWYKEIKDWRNTSNLTVEYETKLIINRLTTSNKDNSYQIYLVDINNKNLILVGNFSQLKNCTASSEYDITNLLPNTKGTIGVLFIGSDKCFDNIQDVYIRYDRKKDKK